MRLKSSIPAFLIIGICLLVSAYGAFCQYAPAKPIEDDNTHPLHKSLEDFENSIGFRYVEAMSKDPRLLFYKKDYKNRIHLGSFGYDKNTRIEGAYEGKMCVLYCKIHTFALVVAPCKEK